MGVSDSKEDQSNQLHLDDYYLIRTEFDQRFGEIQIFKNKHDSSLVLLKDKVFESKEKYESYKNEADIRKRINSSYICPLLYFQSQANNEWCSSFQNVKVAFEYHETSLDKLLREMKTSQEPSLIWFSQDEAWKFLED